MERDRFKEIQHLFAAALEHAPESRVAFLRDAAKGDSSLIAAVERLLAAQREAGDFLQRCRDSQVETRSMTELGYVGCTLKARYQVTSELGSGGFGIVYLGQDIQLHRKPVVIKLLRQRLDINGWSQKKFQQECEALSRINHPSVVGVLDQGETEDGMPFLVMEFVDGVTLRSVVTAGGMDRQRVAALLPPLGRALDAAHDHGVYHRDLKPENIMLRDLGNGQELPVIIDFGVATVRDSETGSTLLTRVAGSYPYMAPEQLHGKPEAASDIYALGVIAYEMLTGQRPFRADSPIGVYLQQKDGVRVLPGEIRSGISKAANKQVLRALAFDPKERHSCASEFSDALAGALTGHHGSIDEAPLAGGARTARKPGISRRRAVEGLSTLLLVSTAGFVIWPRLFPPLPPPDAPKLERTLSYFVMVQRYRNGKPFLDPFRLAGEMLFPADYRIRLMLSSPQAGYLYLINEAPVPKGGPASLNVLFPSPAAHGSALLSAGERVPIPSARDFFVFDDQQGEEKLWIVWASGPVAELEAVKKWVNPRDRGTIKDHHEAAAITDFLARHSTPNMEVIRDPSSRESVLHGRDDVLVRLIKLEHH